MSSEFSMFMDSNHGRERKLEDEARNLVARLPNEIALDIVSRLPITSLIQFKFVCQTWNMFTHDSHLVDLHLSRALKMNPCLIFKTHHPQKEQLLFVELSDHHDDEKTLREIQVPFSTSMARFRVVGSCKGLLCLSCVYDHEAVYIYNPFTREHKRLPYCNHELELDEVVYGFGFHPATNDYKVIKVGYYPHVYYANWSPRNIKDDRPRSEAQLFSLRSNIWRNLGELPYQLHHSPGVLVSGKLHWVTRFNWHLDRLIVSFDLSDDTFQEVPRPDFNVDLSHCSYHLAALRGCLCACLLTSNGDNLEIWIMEEYNKKESWVKRFNIRANFSIVGQDLAESYDTWRTRLQKGSVKVMCLLKNGDILLDCQGGVLVAYSTEKKMLKIIKIRGMPNSCQAISHVGSLNWIDNPI